LRIYEYSKPSKQRAGTILCRYKFASTRCITYDESDFREQRILLMRCVLTKAVCATTLLCGVFAESFTVTADEANNDSDTNAPTTVSSPSTETGTSAKPQALSWLNERGTITTEQVIAELGIRVTPEQRAQIEQAVQKRNAALQQANAALSTALSTTLATNDDELAKKIAEQRERRRMELIRSRQPGRYSGMKKK
jgi:hypothetical protein